MTQNSQRIFHRLLSLSIGKLNHKFRNTINFQLRRVKSNSRATLNHFLLPTSRKPPPSLLPSEEKRNDSSNETAVRTNEKEAVKKYGGIKRYNRSGQPRRNTRMGLVIGRVPNKGSPR